MSENLRAFAKSVEMAPVDEHSEDVVRFMLRGVAEDCPMHVLVQLGQCLVDIRRSELRSEAEKN
jgi:hypothetical protein